MKTDSSQPQQRFLFVGNHRCLDFINTEMIVRGNLTDLLGGHEDLVAWLVQAKIVGASQAAVVMKQWSREDQRQLFEQTISFRTTLRNLAERIVAHRRIPSSTVASINHLLSGYPGFSQLVYAKGRFERQFRSQAAQKDGLLAQLAEAASELLCSGNLSLVKKCRNPACILYFYDTTKNHTRNWCSMQLCGNRLKVAAHYQRKRGKPER